MNRIRFSILLATTAVLLVGSWLPAIAQRADVHPEAETYAEMYQVAVAEANARLSRTPEISLLQQRIRQELPATFAGLYIEHEPVFRVVVKFTGDAKARLARYTDDPLFVAENAPRSLALLTCVQNALGERLLKAGIEFTSGQDVKTSALDLYVLDPAAVSRRFSKFRAVAPFIRVHRTTGFVETTSVSNESKMARATCVADGCDEGHDALDDAICGLQDRAGRADRRLNGRTQESDT